MKKYICFLLLLISGVASAMIPSNKCVVVDSVCLKYDTICWQPTYEFEGHRFQMPSYKGFENEEYIDYVLEYRDKDSCVMHRMMLAIAPMENGMTVDEYDTILQGGVCMWKGERLTAEGTYQKTEYEACGCAVNYVLHLAMSSECTCSLLTDEAIDLGLSVLWAPYNVGATKPEEYGDYFAWGETTSKTKYDWPTYAHCGGSETTLTKYCTNGTYGTVDGKRLLDADDDAAAVNMGGSWQMPTDANMDELINKCSWTWVTQNGVKGYRVTGPNGNSIFLPAAGFKRDGGSNDVQASGSYWSKSLNNGTSTHAYRVNFNSSRVNSNKYYARNLGFTVRAVWPKYVPDVTVDTVIVCHGGTYEWNGAEYSVTGVYADTLKNAACCDSIIKLDLTVLPEIVNPTDSVTVCYGESYVWNGVEYTATGVYVDTLHSVHGCDSVVMLDLTVLPQVAPTIERDTVCFGETYTWRGAHYTVSGEYSDTLQNANGCDSVLILNLTVLPQPAMSVDSVTVCYGESYIWNGAEYSVSGTFVDTLQNAFGCDSVAMLELAILPQPATTIENDTVCYGESYRWNGVEYSATGVYYDTLQTAFGCDSVVALNLIVLPQVATVVDSVVVCHGESCQWRGVEYSATGVYYDTLHTAFGCDSVVSLHLTVLPQVAMTVDSVEICYAENYHWRGVDYSATGVYYDTLQNAYGCDSMIALCLTVMPKVETAISATICHGESYEWNGVTYSASGAYVDTLENVRGCDSVVTLNLTVLPKLDVTLVEATVCYREGYTWNGVEYFEAGAYTDTLHTAWGCDSVVTLNLEVLPKVVGAEENATICYGETHKWRGIEYSKSGVYRDTLQSIDGCDSVVTLNLVVLPEAVGAVENTTICYGKTYTWRGIECSASGIYRDTLLTAWGCDSVLTLTLVVLPEAVGAVETATVCHGKTYKWRGVEYSASGIYRDTLHTAWGCDSVLTLDLTVLPEVVGAVETATICYGETYKWRGVEYSATDVYRDTLQNVDGCDSVLTLNLTVLPEAVGAEENTTICYGETYTWRGIEYFETGVYRDTLQSVHGCDSVVTLNLKVAHTYSSGENATIQLGETYQWRGESYSVAGVYIDKLSTVDGCDSVFTLTLTVKGVVVDAINIAEQCAGTGVMDVEVLLASGKVDDVSFEFSHDAKNAGLANVTLPYNEQMQVQYTSVRAGRYAVTVMGLRNGVKVFEEEKDLTFLYPSSVLKQHWNDVVAVLTYNYNGGYNFVGFQWYKDGELLKGETRSYLSQPLNFGSEYSAMLTEDNGMQMMTCALIATEHVGISDLMEQVDISLYPTLLTGAKKAICNVSDDAVVYVYDVMGKLISEFDVEEGETELDMPYVAGMYMVKIVTAAGKEQNIKLIVR